MHCCLIKIPAPLLFELRIFEYVIWKACPGVARHSRDGRRGHSGDGRRRHSGDGHRGHGKNGHSGHHHQHIDEEEGEEDGHSRNQHWHLQHLHL